MLITSTESQTNFKEADQNHAKEDQLKNMDEQKALPFDTMAVPYQVLMDLLIKSVQIALDHIHQTSVEQLVENVMGATKSDIIFECAQITRKVVLISSTRKILQVCTLHKLTRLLQLLSEFKTYMERGLDNRRHCWILALTQASQMKDFFIASG